MSVPEPSVFAAPQLMAARLAAIVESSSDAIISKDLDGIVGTWNAGAEAIFGYTAAEMVGTSIRRIIPPERQAEEDGILARLRRGERVEPFETVRLTKDGRRLDVSISVSPIRDARGQILGASKIARDISAAKRREREITRLSQLYAGLSQVNQAIVMSPTRDELIEKVCRVLVEFGGFKMAWIGRHEAATQQLVPVAVHGDRSDYLRDVTIYTDERPEGRGPTGTAFRENRPFICNDLLNDPAALPWRARMMDRNLRASAAFPVSCQEQPWGTLTVYADEPFFFREREIALLKEATADLSFALGHFVNEERRRQAEQTMRQERDFSAALVNSLPGVIYFYDETGKFLRWNDHFERVTGYTGAELATMHPLDFFAGEDKERVAARIGEVFTRGESSLEAGFRAKDGHVTPYYFTGVRTVFEGKPCLVGVGIDISERKQAEGALRVAHEQLEQKVARRTDELRVALERAEAADRVKSAFLATMSHELRTPLNSIIGFTGIVLQGLAGPLNAEQTKQLGMVRGSARHLLELINDVLDISKIEAGQLEVHGEPFDLRASLEHTVELVRPLAEKKGLRLSLALAPEIGGMTSDRRRTEQILLNLLNNAVKFTEHGSVTVTADCVPTFRPSPGAEPVPAVQVRVADTGVGIRPEDLPQLFQPFRQIDSGLTRLHEGTGLGLAICRRLATMLGGTTAASSEPARGSVFTVTLPQRMPPHP